MGFKKFLGKMVDNFLEDETSKIIRVQKHDGVLELEGFYKTGKVYLYGIELTKDKICDTYGWETDDVYFSWGDPEDMGGFYLACAILLEVYGKEEVCKIAKQFFNDWLKRLPKEDFYREINVLVWHANASIPRNKRKYRNEIEY